MSILSGFRRKKTMSESSDMSTTDEIPALAGSVGQESGNYLYDIDGKFAYTYYDHQKELYDMDGKHKYKYFNQMKRLQTPAYSMQLPTIADKAKTAIESSAIPIPNSAPGPATNFMYDIEGKIPYTVFDPTGPQPSTTIKKC
eukprot:maker-scaffold141_size315519-snap-gene-0.14 protein:Tk03983 transcript:maker-scaffold141_size315519-snap-gene-0.14-mRNA-1 annotation:"Putative uncharacterized protein MCJ_006000"